MSRKNWGDSFLKSGLPLEHLTLVTFRSLGFICYPNAEYKRPNLSGEETWFEIDLYAHSFDSNKDTDIGFLAECKYHDSIKFWFFLPCDTDRWRFNDRVFNCAPLQTLTDPLSKSAFCLAPMSWHGIVVSQDGTKQENAVHTAVQQVANSFVPHSLDTMFRFRLDIKKPSEVHSSALVPMIVTNAEIFRLKADITDLDTIRSAASPTDIADPLQWTWCYFDPPMDLHLRNFNAIIDYRKNEERLLDRFPSVEPRFSLWPSRPNWIAVVNVKHLSSTVKAIQYHFMGLRTCTSKTALNKTRTVRTI